jgi:hypothetical protein
LCFFQVPSQTFGANRMHNPRYADDRFRWMPSTGSGPCRPPVPATWRPVPPEHRNRWSPWFGLSGRHPRYSWTISSEYVARNVGLEAFVSRAPKEPCRTAPAIKQIVIMLRREHPDWGKKQIADELAKSNDWVRPVSPDTVKRILQQAGLWETVATAEVRRRFLGASGAISANRRGGTGGSRVMEGHKTSSTPPRRATPGRCFSCLL